MEEPYAMPSATRIHPSTSTNARVNDGKKKRPWQSRLPFPPTSFQTNQSSDERLAREESHAPTDNSSTKKFRWWKIRPFKGMANDIRRRAPYYWSDWMDAWDYRVVPATVYMYFAKQVFPPSSA